MSKYPTIYNIKRTYRYIVRDRQLKQSLGKQFLMNVNLIIFINHCYLKLFNMSYQGSYCLILGGFQILFFRCRVHYILLILHVLGLTLRFFGQLCKLFFLFQLSSFPLVFLTLPRFNQSLKVPKCTPLEVGMRTLAPNCPYPGKTSSSLRVPLHL